MVDIWVAIGVTVAAAAASYLATWVALGVLRKRGVMDHPNARSSHRQPVPRGGGIAVVGVTAVGWLALSMLFYTGSHGGAEMAPVSVVLAAGLVLAGLSFADDLRGLPIAIRLCGQIAAVALGIMMLPEGAMVFQDLLPYGGDRILAGFFWLWFVNLYNFMDGIDGITVVETSSIALGLLLLGLLGLGSLQLGVIGAVIAGAAIGFGFWNWPPAKLFLGDVGSVPLGYLLGFLLLSLAAQGQWAAAALLPLYYLADATFTLVRRLGRGDKVWRAHREHLYQHAARAWGSHARVSLVILALNMLLLALALIAAGGLAPDWAALVLGGTAAGSLLWYFHALPEGPVDDA